jgi:hypothetical protein
MSTCYQMYERQPTKLAPEIVHFDQGKDLSGSCQRAQRGGRLCLAILASS